MNAHSRPERVGLIEALGLLPLSQSLPQAKLAIAGDALTPKGRFGLTSLRLYRPSYSVPLWLGRKPMGRLVPITNLYNYLQPAPELGWSVEVTKVRDFRGGRNTYDSHNGTDLAIPPGTRVVAAAPARVLRVSSEFHRGGRKVVLDHGRGLVTTYNHLSRPLVQPGQVVRRGELIALSGYSGLDALVSFPWVPPHVHMNVWLNGKYVDPFCPEHERGVSLWRTHNAPTPFRGEAHDEELPESDWNVHAVDRVLAACRHPSSREEIASQPTLELQIGAAMMQLNYFPTRFEPGLGEELSFYRSRHERAPRLDLPFSHEDYDGVFFPD